MISYHPSNERIKHQYFAYLKDAKRVQESTVNEAAAAISRFEALTNYTDFKKFNIQQAIAFKKHLGEQKNKRTGEPFSKATVLSITKNLQAFFQWLAFQPGYRSCIKHSDTEYFNLSEGDVRIARATRSKPYPRLDEIRRVIGHMPDKTDIEQRNRAVIAFTILTGARGGAMVSMKLKHIDIEKKCVFQDAREVKTKFSKTFMIYFLPVGEIFEETVVNWVKYLREELLWGDDDPLFPKTYVVPEEFKSSQASGLRREHWFDASPIRKIFQEAFLGAGLSYYNPHSFRHTLGRLGESICQTPEEFKAWSQNLGHEKTLTTFNSYGTVNQERQAEIIRKLKNPQNLEDSKNNGLAKEIVDEMERRSLLLPQIIKRK